MRELPSWAPRWVTGAEVELDEDERAFLADVDAYLAPAIAGRQSAPSGQPAEVLDLELTGPREAPAVVVTLTSPRRPGLRLALAWPLPTRTVPPEPSDLDYSVLYAAVAESIDEALVRLPDTAGPDGVAWVTL